VAGYQLVVLEGKDLGRIVPLVGPSLTLGRPGAGGEGLVEFEEPSVCRVHAVLTRIRGGAYELSNRSFTDPARVNGEPATSGVLLVSGSRIRLGDLLAEVRLGASTAGEETTPETTLVGYLEVVLGGQVGTRFPLYLRRILLGRSPACEVQVDDPSVSRFHAALDWVERSPVVVNRSSHGVTLVNGRSVPQGGLSLEPRDTVTLGKQVTLQWLPIDLLAQEEERRTATPEPSEVRAQAGVEGRHVPALLRWRDLAWGAPLVARVQFHAELSGRLEKGESILLAVSEAATRALPHLEPYLGYVVRSGRSLSEALGRFPGAFNRYERGMVAVGEEAGTLAAELQVLARTLEESLAWHRALRVRMRRPLLALVLVAALYQAPRMWNQGFEGCALAWLLSVALTALLVGGVALACRLVGRRDGFRAQQEAFWARLPALGEAMRWQAGARFLGALAPLLEAGLPVARALVLASHGTGSVRHGSRLAKASQSMGQGRAIREVLEEAGVLPAEVLEEIHRGEEEGDLPSRLAAQAESLAGQARGGLDRADPGLARLLFEAGLLALTGVAAALWELRGSL